MHGQSYSIRLFIPTHFPIFFLIFLSPFEFFVAHPSLYQKYNNVAKKLLVSFVKSYTELYGEETVSFNVHVLIHLADGANKHGPLDSYSCYPFEAYIKNIKRYLHAQSKPLQQIFNRLQEDLLMWKTTITHLTWVISNITIIHFTDWPILISLFVQIRIVTTVSCGIM